MRHTTPAKFTPLTHSRGEKLDIGERGRLVARLRTLNPTMTLVGIGFAGASFEALISALKALV